MQRAALAEMEDMEARQWRNMILQMIMHLGLGRHWLLMSYAYLLLIRTCVNCYAISRCWRSIWSDQPRYSTNATKHWAKRYQLIAQIGCDGDCLKMAFLVEIKLCYASGASLQKVWIEEPHTLAIFQIYKQSLIVWHCEYLSKAIAAMSRGPLLTNQGPAGCQARIGDSNLLHEMPDSESSTDSAMIHVDKIYRR